MFLFLRLVLAHLIGDFILQFEELYRLKVRSLWGHFFHALIHAVVSLVLAAPFLTIVWFGPYLIGLAIIHHFQDILKYSIQAKHPKWIFWCFTLDQIVHLAWIATVFFFPFSNEVRGFPNTPLFHQFYTDNAMILLLIAAVHTTFKGTYFLHALRKTFIPGSRPDHFITSFEIWHCLLERLWITSWFLFTSWIVALPVSLLIGFVRLTSPALKNKTDFVLSFLWAAATGILFKYFLNVLV